MRPFEVMINLTDFNFPDIKSIIFVAGLVGNFVLYRVVGASYHTNNKIGIIL